jgi:pimeloyl-ACP methyl ester carboxylesterase
MSSALLPRGTAAHEQSGASAQFLVELFRFEREIEERAPSFFDHHALHVEAAADHDAFAAFCERVRRVFGSSILPVAGRDELNAVDLAFASRFDRDAVLRECGELDDARLQALYDDLAAARAAREQRVAKMPDSLRRRVLPDGLAYYAAGEGTTPIVLLNAIEQELHYWFRLIDALAPRHRLLAWEPRGTIADQIRDVEAVLAAEDVGRCVLAGWCTGPKVAVELAARRPESVEALVFLNPTFRCDGSDAALDTAYERSSDPLFRAVATRPALAASVMKSLQASIAGPAIDVDDEDGLDAGDVVAAMSARLRPHVAHPFRSEEVLVGYARRIVDFWASDSLAKAELVTAPLLVVAAELDRVAAPAMGREVARRFRGARLEFVPYATHYCLYDRPDFVAGLIDDFLRSAS